jgi:hypothetical protein
MRAQFVEQLAVSCCSMIGSISYDGCPSWDGLPLESSLGRAAAIRTPSIERNNMAQKGFEPVRKRDYVSMLISATSLRVANAED